MIYKKIDDFITDWKVESESTLRIFLSIINGSISDKVHENVRSIATLSWHMTYYITEVSKMAGLQVDGPETHSKVPSSIEDIIDAYKNVSASLIKEVKSKWNDSSLNDIVEIFGKKMKKGETLSLLIMHQAHHRGQLTILIRLSGLKIPGIYGPAKEEWAAMNLPAMD